MVRRITADRKIREASGTCKTETLLQLEQRFVHDVVFRFPQIRPLPYIESTLASLGPSL
jgi:hypothetical protein